MDWVPVVFIIFKVGVFGTCMFFAIKWHHDQAKKKQKEQEEQAQAQQQAQAASAAADVSGPAQASLPSPQRAADIH